jgi:hypothetical protein
MEPSLRDLFAGLATIGLLTRYGAEGFDAIEAYEIADKLLSEREPEEGLAKLAKRTRKASGKENA